MALDDAFYAIGGKLITEEVIKDLAQLSRRTTEKRMVKKKIEDKDYVDSASIDYRKFADMLGGKLSKTLFL